MHTVINIIISSFAILVSAYLLPGVRLENYFIALLVAGVLTFLNHFIKPLLVFFTIPITIFTFGFFLLVINAIIILLTDYIVDGFEVSGFWWALIFSLVTSFTTFIFENLNFLFPQKQNE